MPRKPYVPQDVGELLAYLSHMMLASPTFKDETGYLPWENIDTTFFALNQGLLGIRKQLGEERYAALKAMSDRMRALFEADPEDKTDDTHAGCMLIHEMEDVLIDVAKRRNSKK
jgi:tRNA 2-selenouridine synthase SelU